MDMTPRQDPCQESSSVRRIGCGLCLQPAQIKDSGYEANSIAFPILRRGKKKSTLLDSPMFRGCMLRNEPPGDAIPIARQSDAAWARCAGKAVAKKIGSGTERNDTRENETTGTARSSSPPRGHWKCAASPCSRTSRNAQTRRSEWAPPTHKTANRSRGIATGATASPQPRSRAGCVFGSAEDCRYDRLDKSISFTPG